MIRRKSHWSTDLAEAFVLLTARRWSKDRANGEASEIFDACEEPAAYFQAHPDDAFLVEGIEQSDPYYKDALRQWLVYDALFDVFISGEDIYQLARQALAQSEPFKRAEPPRDWDEIYRLANVQLASKGGLHLLEFDNSHTDSVEGLEVHAEDVSHAVELAQTLHLRIVDSAIPMAKRERWIW